MGDDRHYEEKHEPLMDIFKCKGCGFEYDADVHKLAPRTHNCPECGTENGPEQHRNRLWNK